MPISANSSGAKDSRPWAIVPAKETLQAKQRLAEVMSASLRQQFALVMLEDVLAALSSTPGLAGIIVVTTDRLASQLGRRYDVRIITACANEGYTQAVTSASHFLAAEGIPAYLAVPGDIPLVSPDEVGQLLAKHAMAPAFSIVPAHDRRGTNAVMCSPPGAVRLRFGGESFMSHLLAAHRAGIRPTVLHLPGIGLDIDQPRDLVEFVAQPSPTRTWAFLNCHHLTESQPAMPMRGSAR